MIAICTMKNNVGYRSFGSEQFSAVKVAVDQSNLRVLRCDLRAFVAIANERGDLDIRVGG